MPPLPSVTGAQVVKALGEAGFELARVNGSHHVLRHPDGRCASVPVHRGRDLPPGTLRGLLRIIEMSVDDFLGLL